MLFRSTFLPGLLKGLAASFNYSWIETHGLRGGTRYLTRREVAGFIPHSANASLRWSHRGFSVRALYNFTGEYITSLSAITTPALNQYRYSMKTLNVGASYQYRPNLGFSVDIANLFNANSVLNIRLEELLRPNEESWIGHLQLTATNRLVTFHIKHSMADATIISDHEHLDPFRGDRTHYPLTQLIRLRYGEFLKRHGWAS